MKGTFDFMLLAAGAIIFSPFYLALFIKQQRKHQAEAKSNRQRLAH